MDTAHGMSGAKARQLPNNTPVCQVLDSEEKAVTTEANVPEVDQEIVLKCSKCQYTTPECQSLCTANWILQSHRRRVNHFGAPVRQEKDSEQEVVTKPTQKEGVISPKDTAMSIGSVKAEQTSSKVTLTCEKFSHKTSQLRPSKA